jgi:secreted trypsin-like serine protease
MASLRTLFISLLAALTLAAAPTASAIVDGSDDTEHDYVVFVGQQVQLPNGMWVNGSACSGVLVAPTIVLTAAHCTLGPPPSFPQRAVVRQGESIFAPEAAALGTYNLHPGFCIGCPGGPEGFANNDLAVVVLSSPLPGPYANLPKLGFTEKHFEKKEKQLLAVGYGLSAPPSTGLGTRRSAQAGAVIASNAPNFLFLPVPSKKKYGTVCAGDSGGAALVGDTLVAIHSIGDDACGGPSYAYRLDTPDAQSFLSKYLDVRG